MPSIDQELDNADDVLAKADLLHDIAIHAIPLVGKADDCPALNNVFIAQMYTPNVRLELERATTEYQKARMVNRYQKLHKKEEKPPYIACPLCGGDGFLIMESFLDEMQVICHRCRGRKEIPNPELSHG